MSRKGSLSKEYPEKDLQRVAKKTSGKLGYCHYCADWVEEGCSTKALNMEKQYLQRVGKKAKKRRDET